MIVVTTPTGQIGSRVVKNLLERGEAVRVVVRDSAKLGGDVRERVDVVVGSHESDDVMLRALSDADGVFHLIPPLFTSTDDDAHAFSFTQPLCHALERLGHRHVVTVSGIGRGVDVDAGVVSASFRKDEMLESTGTPLRELWCPGFIDNFLQQVEPLKHQGTFYLPQLPDLRMPMVTTGDIAAMAADLLHDRRWTGQAGIGVLGPEDLSFDEAAAILSHVFGKPIRYERVTYAAYEETLVSHGASPYFAHSLAKMFRAKDDGLDLVVQRNAQNTTPTTLHTWAREVLLPLVA